MKDGCQTATVTIAPAPGIGHSMGAHLIDYVMPKVPEELLRTARGRARVVGRDVLDSMTGKKSGKLFNWRRPQFSCEAGTALECRCPPGRDYVYHYARLAATAAAILGFSPAVELELPNPAETSAFIERWLPTSLPHADVAILGYVDRLFRGRHSEWMGGAGFKWSKVNVSGQRVLLIGCEFSFWGDLAGELVASLARRGIHWVTYVGKLGSLDRTRQPNHWLATGRSSMVDEVRVEWESRLEIPPGETRIISDCRHTTSVSPLDEDMEWYERNAEAFDVVDPEIGRMALAAAQLDVSFDYLHIISNNLSGRYDDGLYFERAAKTAARRAALLRVVETTLAWSLHR